MLVDLINDTRAADESMRTYVTDDGESGDWLAAASSASSRPVTKTSSDIADEEIALWKMRLEPLQSHKNPLDELRRASSNERHHTRLSEFILSWSLGAQVFRWQKCCWFVCSQSGQELDASKIPGTSLSDY